MTATEFIKNKIDNLVNDMPNIKCSYEFDRTALVHLIEILPSSIYEKNDDYIDSEQNIIFDFIENFPDENISFITSGSIVKINNPEYIKLGAKFGIINSISNNLPTIQLISPKFYQTTPIKQVMVSFWDERKAKKELSSESVIINNNNQSAMAA
jgi:hypothetical protein